MEDNKMHDLRKELFDTIRMLRNNSIDISRAKVICEVAQAIINSAKVEVDFIKAIGATNGSGFIPIENKQTN